MPLPSEAFRSSIMTVEKNTSYDDDDDDLPLSARLSRISNLGTCSSKRPLDHDSDSLHISIKKSKVSPDDDDDNPIFWRFMRSIKLADKSFSVIKEFIERELALVEKLIEKYQTKRRVEEQRLQSLERYFEECLEYGNKKTQASFVKRIIQVYKKMQREVEKGVKELVAQEAQVCLMEDMIRKRKKELRANETQLRHAMDNIDHEDGEREEEELKKTLENFAECTKELETKEEELDAMKTLIGGQAIKLESERNSLLKLMSIRRCDQCAQMKDFESRKKQIEGMVKELGSKEKHIEEQAKELESKEKQLESQRKEIESKKEKFEGQIKNLKSKKKHFESRVKELASKEKQLEGQGKEFESKKEELEGQMKEFESKEEEFEGEMKDLESKKKHFESQVKELGSKLEGRVKEFESKVKEFESQVKDLESKKKHFESKMKELKTKAKQLGGRAKEIESRERQLEGRAKEFESKEVEFEGQVKEFGTKQKHFESRVKELGSKEKQFEGRVKEFGSKEKQFERQVKELESKEEELKGQVKDFKSKEKHFEGQWKEFGTKEKHFESRVKELGLKEKQFEGRVKEFGSKEKQFERRVMELESKEEELKGRVKDFKSKEQQFEAQWKELESKENKFKVQVRELEFEVKQFEVQVKDLKSKENQLDGKVRDLESKQNKFDGQLKELELRDKQCDSLIKSFEKEIESGNQLSPTIDGRSLRLLPSEQREELESHGNAILVNLLASSDPSKVVLDIIQDPIIPQSRKGDNAVVIDGSHIILLEQLTRISPAIKPQVREEAMKLALDLKAYISVNSVVVLLLLSIYGLVPSFDEDEVFKLFGFAAQHKIAVELFGTLGFAHKISDFVQNLIRKQQYIEAVRFICAYNLADKYRPVDLFREHVKNAKLISESSCKKTNSIEIKDKARDQDIDSIRTVLRCISDNNIESEDLRCEIRDRILELNRQKGK